LLKYSEEYCPLSSDSIKSLGTEFIKIMFKLLNPFSNEIVSEYKQEEMFISFQYILISFLPLNLINCFFFKEIWDVSNWGVVAYLGVIILNVIWYSKFKIFCVNRIKFQLIGLSLINWCILDVSEFGKILLLGIIVWSMMNSFLLSWKISAILFGVLFIDVLCIGYMLPKPANESWLYVPFSVMIFSLLMQLLIYMCLYGFKDRRNKILDKMKLVREYDEELLLNLIYLNGAFYSEYNKFEKKPKFEYLNSLISEVRALIISSTMGNISNECKNLRILSNNYKKENNQPAEAVNVLYDQSREIIFQHILNAKDSIQEEHIKILDILNDITIDLSTFISFEQWNGDKFKSGLQFKKIIIKDFVEDVLNLGELMLSANQPKFDMFYKGEEQISISISAFRTLLMFLIRLFADETLNEDDWIPFFIENDDEKQLKLILPIKNDTLSVFYATSLYKNYCKNSNNKDITLYHMLNQIILPIKGTVIFSMKSDSVFIEITIPATS